MIEAVEELAEKVTVVSACEVLGVPRRSFYRARAADSSPEPEEVPRERPRSKVALVKTTDRAAGTHRAIELVAASTLRGRHVLLKPNLNSADPAPGSTHPEVLRALLEDLSDLGARSITIGDRRRHGRYGGSDAPDRRVGLGPPVWMRDGRVRGSR